MMNIIVEFITIQAITNFDNRKEIKMKSYKVLLGEFESELYAEVAKRDLRIAGIKAKTLKNYSSELLPLLNKTYGIHLMVPVAQLEEAKKILKAKFI